MSAEIRVTYISGLERSYFEPVAELGYEVDIPNNDKTAPAF